MKFDVEKMCKVFKVSRSGYYQWCHREPSKRALETRQIKADIRMIYRRSKNRYGSPKITSELQGSGLDDSPKSGKNDAL